MYMRWGENRYYVTAVSRGLRLRCVSTFVINVTDDTVAVL